jgi:hypothetical protein
MPLLTFELRHYVQRAGCGFAIYRDEPQSIWPSGTLPLVTPGKRI